MDLQKVLDSAIRDNELKRNSHLKSGYQMKDGREYDTYLENDCWELFKKDMEENHPAAFKQFDKGGGKELKERGNSLYPPKMASFGSSSRMIYNLSKENETFEYEKKLTTTVGGIANLDGFLELEDKYIFIEAKCREPYATKNKKVDTAYQKLYEYITGSEATLLECIIRPNNDKMMIVDFEYDNETIGHFDIKQMICHLLGIGTAFLKGKFEDKEIEFRYLLFNPRKIDIPEGKEREGIYKIYDRTCEECNAIDFKTLFRVILEYLRAINVGEDKDITGLCDRFSFRLCDQEMYRI